MVDIARLRVGWTGVPGGGVSTFYSLEADASAAMAALHDFFTGIRDSVAPAVTWDFPSVGDVLDSGTGSLVGSWTGGTLANVTGNATDPDRAAGVGARIQWETDAIIGGRRVRGATYITDLGTGAYDADGTLDSGTLTNLRTEADDLVATGYFLVWSRPGPNGSGTSAFVAATVADRVTALRSRRF